jgi:hypothetical protein
MPDQPAQDRGQRFLLRLAVMVENLTSASGQKRNWQIIQSELCPIFRAVRN